MSGDLPLLFKTCCFVQNKSSIPICEEEQPSLRRLYVGEDHEVDMDGFFENPTSGSPYWFQSSCGHIIGHFDVHQFWFESGGMKAMTNYSHLPHLRSLDISLRRYGGVERLCSFFTHLYHLKLSEMREVEGDPTLLDYFSQATNLRYLDLSYPSSNTRWFQPGFITQNI